MAYGLWNDEYVSGLQDENAALRSDVDKLLTQRDDLLEDVEKAMKLANHRWCEWGERALSVSVVLDEAIDKARAAILRVEEGR